MKFSELARAFGQLETTHSRARMVSILGNLIARLAADELGAAIYLTQARLGPPFSTIDFGIDQALATRALAEASGQPARAIQDKSRATGDLGSVAMQVLTNESSELSILDVFESLKNIAAASGKGAQVRKVAYLRNLLRSVDRQGGGYIIRVIQGRLRLGVGDPTIMDALSWAVKGSQELRPAIERAYDLTSDLGFVATLLFQRGLEAVEAIKPQPGRPVRPELAERLPTARDIIARLGRVVAEPKYDGIRLQVHRMGDQIAIFSRRSEDNTASFPEIVAAARQHLTVSAAITEGEATAYDPDTGEYLPFQMTSQRRRKHEVGKTAARYPLRLFVFDLISAEGQDYTSRPLEERRHRLQQIVSTEPDATIAISTGLVTSDPNTLERFFLECVEAGVEGIVAKRLDSPYKAGARTYDWVKLKRGYQAELRDTIDAVIVGYLFGRGRRTRFGIGSLLVAVYASSSDTFRTIARVGSGLSDEEWIRLRQLLDHLRVDHQPARVDSLVKPDVWVEPHYVVEVYADEITRSPVHTAGKRNGEPGYALRFPRMVDWIRTDRSPEDATTQDEILKLYTMQH